MAHFDFREALSTPEQKSFVVPAAVAVAQPTLPPFDSYFPEVGLSRSAWANIVFVAIAALGGMACAFYFFNGAEVLRAAAAWPAEFLYPRPPLTELAETNERPNPVDEYSSESTSAARKNDKVQDLADQTFRPTQLAQFPAPTNSFAATPPTPTNVPPLVPPIVPAIPPGVTPVIPPVGQPIIPPVIPPVVPPGVPQPDSILGEVQKLVAGADTVGPSVYQTANQTVSSVIPKKVSTVSARTTASSARKKVVNTRQKASARSISATSTSRIHQLSSQVQSSGVQNQTMFGGGMGTVSGISSAGTAGGTSSSSGTSGTGVAGVGTSGGVTGPSGVGSLPGAGSAPGIGTVGGLPGVGGISGGLPGVGGISGGLPGIGGVLGGHH